MASLFDTVDKEDGMRAALDHLGIRYKQKMGWQKITCPNGAAHATGVDRHPSCSMRLDVGVTNCHSCGFKGDWARIMYEIVGMKVDEAYKELGLEKGYVEREASERNSDSPFLF